jgi:ABC-2 type transport system ATP-binding protein
LGLAAPKPKAGWAGLMQSVSNDRIRRSCMLELRELTRFYGAIPAIRGVNASLAPGDVLGLLGPNGSGKSTTVKMLVGLLEPTSGAVVFDGVNIADDLTGFKTRVGYVPEEAHLYTFFTPPEYLEFVGRLRGLDDRTLARRIDEFLRLFNLESARYQPITACSKGMRQKVLISAALLHNPDILVLDEPCSGLDVSTTMALRELIQRLSAMGKIVVYSSHVMDMVEKVSTRVLIVHRSRVVADNSVSALRDLLSLPSLEAVFAELTVDEDVSVTADQLVAAMQA